MGAYLGIVRARMGSRLDARFDIAHEIDGASFPAMVLVPLVEHAVRHGLEPLTHGGRLEVRAAKEADRLQVTVALQRRGRVVIRLGSIRCASGSSDSMVTERD